MKKLIVSMVAILLLIGCASTTNGVPSRQPRPAITPKRLVTPASDEYMLYARGLSTDQLVEEEADRAAILRARQQLAATIETHIKSLTKQAREQVGIGRDAELNSQYSNAVKATVKQTLNITVPFKAAETRWDENRNGFRAEVIYKVDIGPVNKSILENIKQRKNLYERFRTSELFKELEEEIEKKESK